MQNRFQMNMFEDTKLGVITVASRQDNEEFFEKCQKHHVPIVFGMKDDFDAFPEEFLKRLLTGSKIIFTNEVEREIIEKFMDLKILRNCLILAKWKLS